MDLHDNGLYTPIRVDILTVNYEWPGVTENCGGGGRIGKQLVKGLRDRGHTVTVVSDGGNGHYATFPLRSYRDVHRAFSETLPDIVHGQFSVPTSLMLPNLCREFHAPLVVTPMGADVYDPTRFRAVRPLMNVANKYIFRRSDAIAPPSSDINKRLPDYAQAKSDVIHYGIDPNDWEWSGRDRHDPLRVLTVCRLVERKNLRVASDTIDRYRRHHGAVRWRVVGKGPQSDFIENCNTGVWRGYVDDLQAEFDWADVFFLPSKHEAFGIVFLETLAAGVPVVTSDCGGQTDIVDKGLVGEYARASVENQTDALRIVADDYGWYQRNTRGYVANNFARSHMVDAYEELFQRLA